MEGVKALFEALKVLVDNIVAIFKDLWAVLAQAFKVVKAIVLALLGVLTGAFGWVKSVFVRK